MTRESLPVPAARYRKPRVTFAVSRVRQVVGTTTAQWHRKCTQHLNEQVTAHTFSTSQKYTRQRAINKLHKISSRRVIITAGSGPAGTDSSPTGTDSSPASTDNSPAGTGTSAHSPNPLL
ncbi:hypothetical protein SAMN05421878_102217 [Actinobaculum suis]|uniref:Uncharacterized protein n=1 Tax=Actinobaculum suis TaxID=1657 RepID=A0A1G7AIP3_9ACTO|nr:hypothetical protein SAMN05421878_102217 [Actinobaculum suis]